MLRPATIEDASAVAKVLVDSRSAFIPYAPSPHAPSGIEAWVAQNMIPSSVVTVAEVGQRIVAVLAVSDEQAVTWIDQLYVLPGYENQGLGTKLLSFVHNATTKPVRLFTFQQNTGARRFYERNGYTVISLSDGQGNEEKCPDVLYERSTKAEA